MSIAVTGATGHLGRLVITDLLARGIPAGEIAALVRDPDRAADLAGLGVEVRLADYDRPETLKDAFRAGDRALLISGNVPGRRAAQHVAVVEAATAAGVSLLAYTGVLGGPDADFELADDHKATEQRILASGLPYVFLRHGWYTEVYTEMLGPVLEHGAVFGSAGDGRVATASRADYAAAAAAVLAGAGEANRAWELCGDTAWSLAEYAALVGELAGREIAYRNLSPDEHRELLVAAGVPEGFAPVLVGVDRAIERGMLASTSGDLARLIGRPTTPLRETVAAALKG